jgi:hypothetical protein
MSAVRGQATGSVTPASSSTWMALTLELWLIVALGLATGITALLFYGRMADLERRVDAIESAAPAIDASAQARGTSRAM